MRRNQLPLVLILLLVAMTASARKMSRIHVEGNKFMNSKGQVETFRFWRTEVGT